MLWQYKMHSFCHLITVKYNFKKPTILTEHEKRTWAYWSLFFSSLVMRTKLVLVKGESFACNGETRWIYDNMRSLVTQATQTTCTLMLPWFPWWQFKSIHDGFKNSHHRHQPTWLMRQTDMTPYLQQQILNCASWISFWLI